MFDHYQPIQQHTIISGGANVLYMDGHVQFQRYGQTEPAPVNQGVAAVVGILTAES
jgi:prepilin-type processing-associated H-X9-DG protein